jgi:NAD(P)-dependent dehydrogenase (short-subunit alcohol dehydrogenase family)
MRSRRAGLIVNVGSLAGRPRSRGRSAQRANAPQRLHRVARARAGSFNIRVVVVEPSFFRTSLHHSLSRGARAIADYDTVRPRLESALTHAIETGEDPSKVAAAIAAIAATARPALRYRVGFASVWIPRVRAVVPERLFLWVLRRRFRLL